MLDPIQRQLVADNRRLTTFVLKRHFLPHRVYPGRWDVLRAASVTGLVDAALRCNLPQLIDGKWHAVNPHTGALVRFSTFACLTIWGTCNNALRKHQKEPVPVSLVLRQWDRSSDYSDVLHPSSRLPTPVDALESTDRADSIRRSLKWLLPLDAECVAHKFGLTDGCPKSCDEVAAIMGISKVRVGQRITRAVKELREGRAGRLLRQYAEGV